MTRRLCCALVVGIVGAASNALRLSGQETAAPVVHTRARDRAGALDAALMGRTVSVRFERVTLREALATLARRADVQFVYVWQEVPVEKTVSLVADRITVRDALAALLEGTGVEPVVSESGRVRLRPKAEPTSGEPATWQVGPTVTGRVTDAVTRAPLDQVAVRVEGPGLGAVTTSDGRYTVRNVPTGTYHVTARRVGYTPLTKTVTIATDSTVIADFPLAAAATKLNEVVTTAVGDQRRYEVGNAISTINADSIAPTAPITSLTDLISARAPGVEVLETSGMTGSGETIRIRGVSSLVLQNDPILIVDGVRQDNSAGDDLLASFTASGAGHPTPTRLNDIDFNDVASVDILKGPSASTEYGTDAANGVLVIKTKHGAAGAPQWKVAAERAESDIPEHFPQGYYSWGHTTDGTNTAVACRLVPVFGSPASTAGTCVVDSVTQWNPLNHAATSIFGIGNREKYDLSVSGGSEAVRYFVSGGLANERGIIRMPTVFRELADTANLGLPNAALSPNSEQQRSVRVNMAMRLGPATDLMATGSYLSNYQQTPNATLLYFSTFSSPALRSPTHYYGYDFFGSSMLTPLSQLTQLGWQNIGRATGGMAANWRPTGWFVGHATVGLDHGSQRNQALNYPLANPMYEYFIGPFLGIANVTTDVYSVDLRGIATVPVMRSVRAVTSGGLQMVDTRTTGQSAYTTTGITATNLTLNGATGPVTAQQGNRQATLGGYGEEEVSVAERLFVTGALRVDAGSGFGRNYAAAAYPKASVSWLAVDQRATTLRVRGAFGASGVQPINGAATTLHVPGVEYLGGTTVTTYPLSWPGNPNLRPERSAELEGGADIGVGTRVSLEVTGYSKTTHDALVNVNLGESLGSYTYQENIGEVRNTGVEGSMTAGVVRSRLVTWDVALNASANHNTLVSLAPGVLAQTVSVYPAQERQTPGYPLYGIWAQRVMYADANHDGVIEANEVTLADSASYISPSLPTQEASVSTHVGLWRGALTVAGLLDYRGGYRIATNYVSQYADYIGRTAQDNIRTAPLWLQARAVENATFNGYPASDAESGAFLRLREVSMTYVVPRVAAHALRVQSVSVTGAVRNLALWTRYTGVDPEVSNTLTSVQSAPTLGNNMLNNNVRADYGAVPLARHWTVRLNVGL